MSSGGSNEGSTGDGIIYGDTTGKAGSAQHGGSGGAGAPNITGTQGAPTGGGTATTHNTGGDDHDNKSESNSDSNR